MKRLFTVISVPIVATLFASLIPNLAQADSTVDTINITVNSACTLSSTLGTNASGISGTTDGNGNNTYTTTMSADATKEIVGSKFTTICNDTAGYSLYAIGYSGDSYDTTTNTKMLGAHGNINTGTSTSGTSSWSMKLISVSGITPPQILNSFDNYHAVPSTFTQIAKYTTNTPSTTSTGSTIQSKYQIYISGEQPAGSYTGKVKYTIVHPNDAPAPAPKTIATATTMQEVETCPASLAVGTSNTLTDTRDSSTYTVEKLADGNCWMTQNLRITGTVSSAGSNFSGSSFNVCAEDLANDSSYSVAECHNSNNTTTGVWYNYAAASAGTITGLINTDEATSDICPSGWQMPSYSQISGVTSYKTTFNPVAGGRYHKKDNDNTSNGYWWSTTAYDGDSRHNLRYNEDKLEVHHLLDRDDGLYIRCVKK